MKSEEAGIQFSDVASIGGKAIQGVPGHAEPAGRVKAGAVESEQLRAATSCQLVYPVSEGLTLVGGAGFKELKEKAARVAYGCALS